MDKRALFIGIAVPVIVIAFNLVIRLPVVAAPVNAVIPIYIWGDTAAMLIGDATLIACVCLLPCVITIVARRHAFLLALLPLIVVQIDNSAYDVIHGNYGGLRADFAASQVEPLGAVWVVSSGVGLFIRWLLKRRAERKAQFALQAKIVVTDGAWPPPPTDSE